MSTGRGSPARQPAMRRETRRFIRLKPTISRLSTECTAGRHRVPRGVHYGPTVRTAPAKGILVLRRSHVISERLTALAGPLSPGVQSDSGRLFLSGQVS